MSRDDKEYTQALLGDIRSEKNQFALMEVCGTHTMAIAKSGIRELIPDNLRLLSGPGCPVCVTAQGDIDGMIELSKNPDVTLLTFGDMMRVPGTATSLAEERSRGADVRVVYSPMDAVQMAAENPHRQMVFLGIGFETTAPTVAVSIEEAYRRGLENYSVLSLHKLVPPALEAIFSDPDIKVDGLICPGHVSAVIGLSPYEVLAEKYHKPCVVTGFDTLDILEGIVMLLHQLRQGEARAEIQYRRVVKREGNPVAAAILERVFQPADARWRGLGAIPGSGLAVRPAYQKCDARSRFQVPEIEDKPIKGCACGEVLTGRITPQQCALFGRACTPLKPIGPCMVSHEGACAAYYRYTPVKGR
ncbi:MAG TPA: hydrogenase formation protein HypD [Syntrophomonadaceae bacterium]|nr:hydrogenase formation protein HypD [Syntrophomonadaceae bacterium]